MVYVHIWIYVPLVFTIYISRYINVNVSRYLVRINLHTLPNYRFDSILLEPSFDLWSNIDRYVEKKSTWNLKYSLILRTHKIDRPSNFELKVWSHELTKSRKVLVRHAAIYVAGIILLTTYHWPKHIKIYLDVACDLIKYVYHCNVFYSGAGRPWQVASSLEL